MEASPLGLDVFTWIGAACFVATVLALTSIWRARSHSVKTKVIWTAIVVVLPIIGAVAWFFLGRERRRIR